MSDIPRYKPVANDKYGITDDVDGKLCEYRDYARLKAEVDNLRKNADISPSQSPHEIERLKAEVERLDHQVRYWRIEAEVDNARWLRCLEDLEKLRKDSQP